MKPGIYRDNTLLATWEDLEKQDVYIEKDYDAFKDAWSTESFAHNILEQFGKDLTLIFPEVEKIGAHAFRYCNNVTNIILPDTITKIGQGAFKQSSVKNITFSKKLEYLGPLAFAYCNNLEKVILPENLTEIMDAAFTCCNKLTDVTLPNSLLNIHASVFEKCRNLAYIKFPNNLKDIYSSAFMECEKLEEVIFNEGLERIWTSAFKNTNIKNLNLPKSLVKIETTTFEDCKNIKNIVFPKSLDEIGNYAFSGCTNLETVVFSGDDIDYIGRTIFEKCPKLNAIYASKSFKDGNPWFENEYKEIFIIKSLDTLINSGKSFREINKIVKKDEGIFI